MPCAWAWLPGSGYQPRYPAGFSLAIHTLRVATSWAMKRAASISALLDTSTPWLAWWQELILNWVSSWHAVSTLVVTNANGDDYVAWEVPSDLELQRLQLEELLDAPVKE